MERLKLHKIKKPLYKRKWFIGMMLYLIFIAFPMGMASLKEPLTTKNMHNINFAEEVIEDKIDNFEMGSGFLIMDKTAHGLNKDDVLIVVSDYDTSKYSLNELKNNVELTLEDLRLVSFHILRDGNENIILINVADAMDSFPSKDIRVKLDIVVNIPSLKELDPEKAEEEFASFLAEQEIEKIISVNFDDFNKMFRKLTDLQREDYMEKYKDNIVTWKLKVIEVEPSGLFSSQRAECISAGLRGVLSSIDVKFLESEENKMLNLKRGEVIYVQGTLCNYAESIAELIHYTVKESVFITEKEYKNANN